MPTWFRVLRPVGVGLGAAGVLAAVWHAFARPGPTEVFGGLTWLAVGVVPLFAVGVWLAYRRPEHPQARRLLLMGSALAVDVGLEGLIQEQVARHGAGSWLVLPNLVYQYAGMLGLIAGSLLLASFPDGTVERPWQRRVLRLAWLNLALPVLLLLSNNDLMFDAYLFPDGAPRVPSPIVVPWLAPLGGPLHSVYYGYLGAFVVLLLFVRFGLAGPEQRARLRLMVWVTAALIPSTGLMLALFGRYPDPPVWLRLENGVAIVLLMMIPVSIVIGIVRHRLFDIDLAVRRSMVYGSLSLLIAAVYLGLTAAPGLALGSQIPVELAVLLTIVAAAAFQPLRRRLERLADRLVFGERVNRYQLLTTFGASLEQTVDLPELLPRLAETVRKGLAARWVRVRLPGAVVEAGEASGAPTLVVPLERGGEIIGHIECAKDDDYAHGDRELLATLAGQAATAIANVRLTAALAEQVDELARSRARIVAAADSERRRIERNIHDGAQQQVVALMMKLRLARNQVGRGDRDAASVFDELQADARELLTDLRELAHGIHPPVLSDQGLVAAVEARADRLPLEVRVHADAGLHEQRLGAEVEGAAYFVICEALTNVVKHASAHRAGVDLSTVDGHLMVRVHDDGVGLVSRNGKGHGLTNLRDRVEALGGQLHVSSEPGGGTSVHAELPVGADDG